jgi:uncharacterized protein (DUF111 family)
MRDFFERSELEGPVKDRSLSVLTRLAQAEAFVRSRNSDDPDAIRLGTSEDLLYVVGVAAGLAVMGVKRICCSSVNLGAGMLAVEEGGPFVPDPVTAELIKGIPVYSDGAKGELLTPTGAALVAALVDDFGLMPAIKGTIAGHGVGSSHGIHSPLVRVVIGEQSNSADTCQAEQVGVLDARLVEGSSELSNYLIAELLGRGAYDVFVLPAQTHGARSGDLLTVICSPHALSDFCRFLALETCASELRWRVEDRLKVERFVTEIHTRYGSVRVKIARLYGQIVNLTPEYDDCRHLAQRQAVPLKAVLDEARSVALQSLVDSLE